MESVKLMNRTDTKFSFNAEKLNMVLEQVLPFYNCLCIESKMMSRYQTLYYDTADLKLYKQHHNGRLNRYKIRHRTYKESGAGFLEVKFKSNKGRTVKERIPEKTPAPSFQGKAYEFLAGELPFDPVILQPVVWINYTRITLVSKKNAERVTIDINPEFKTQGESLNLDKLVIAEVKQEKRKSSPFLEVMKKMRIREGAISKYCFAIAFTHKGIKKNNFKEKLLSLNQIINYDITTSNYGSFGQ